MKTATVKPRKSSVRKTDRNKKGAVKIKPDNPNHKEDFEWLLEKMVTPPDSK